MKAISKKPLLSTIKATAKKLSLSLLSLLFTLLVLEVGLRIYTHIRGIKIPEIEDRFQPSAASYHEFHSELGWLLKPNFSGDGINVNALGFRSSTTYSDEEHTTKRKILLLGDSMIFGLGASQEHIVSEILNRELPDYYFINTGTVGYSTAQEYLLLKTHIERTQPELVILFFVQANDIWWNARSGHFNPHFSTGGTQLIYNAPQRERKVPFYKRAMCYRYLIHTGLGGRDLTYLRQRLAFRLHGENSSVWRVTKRLLQAIGNVSRQHGARVVLVDVPTGNQLAGSIKSTVRQELLRQLAEEEGYLYYDLMSYYPANYRELYLRDDPGHWSELGHRFAADMIKDHVLKAASNAP